MHRRDQARGAFPRVRVWRAVAAATLAGTVVLLGSVAMTNTGVAGADSPAPASAATPAACHHQAQPASTPCPAPGTYPVSLVTDAPSGPFSSGQIITVTVAPNSILKHGKRQYIRECAAPGGVIPRSPKQCDLRTTQRLRLVAGHHGTVVYQGYPIFALPDTTTLGEPSTGTPVCDLAHPCVLFIGQDRTDFDQPHVWSLPFSVTPTSGDTGANPGNGLPEVPYVVVLPILGLAIFGGSLWLRRRRTPSA